jgi:hypothetical protein
MTKLKVIIGIIAFYLIVFHFFIRMAFFPNMPAEELVGLALMMMVSYNFVAYYKGWTMHLLYGHTKATDSLKHRLFALCISVLVVGGILYAWIKQGLESL